MPRLPPRSHGETDHVQHAYDGTGAQIDSQEQGDPDKKLGHTNQVSEEDCVRQDKIREHGPIEADRASIQISLKIFLEAAMSEGGAKHFVLAEKQEEHRCRDSCHRNGA